jgi:hypothetical protein
MNSNFSLFMVGSPHVLFLIGERILPRSFWFTRNRAKAQKLVRLQVAKFLGDILPEMGPIDQLVNGELLEQLRKMLPGDRPDRREIGVRFVHDVEKPRRRKDDPAFAALSLPYPCLAIGRGMDQRNSIQGMVQGFKFQLLFDRFKFLRQFRDLQVQGITPIDQFANIRGRFGGET